MTNEALPPPMLRAGPRLLVMFAVFVVVTAVAGLIGRWTYAFVVGWCAACCTYIGWVLAATYGKDAEQTRTHARADDPNRLQTDLLILGSSIASLGAVIVVLAEAEDHAGAARAVYAGLAVLSVSLSWMLVHTLYCLTYARLYYADPVGGLDFHDAEPPTYVEFAYLAFTIGTAFAVSDTDVTRREMRRAVLRHTLLAYVFGAVILGATVNLIVGL